MGPPLSLFLSPFLERSRELIGRYDLPPRLFLRAPVFPLRRSTAAEIHGSCSVLVFTLLSSCSATSLSHLLALEPVFFFCSPRLFALLVAAPKCSSPLARTLRARELVCSATRQSRVHDNYRAPLYIYTSRPCLRSKKILCISSVAFQPYIAAEEFPVNFFSPRILYKASDLS